jgi:tRNA nucleotidyltransferase/poly(A) polymerase
VPKSIPIHAVIADVLDFYYSNRPDKGEIALLSGNEIMEVLQLKPGKQVGAIIEEIKKAERQGLISTKEEALKLITGQCKEGRP